MLSEIIERKEIRMHKIIVWVLTFAFLLPRVAVAGDTVSVRNAIEVATTSVVIPSVANVTGLTGSVFKTRISLLNPTAFTYPIEATFYDVSGNMSKVNITMAANQMRVYDNFLGDVFGTTGAGSVRFESRQITGGSPNFQFVVNAEVWTIVSSGRYGTSVTTLIGSASNNRGHIRTVAAAADDGPDFGIDDKLKVWTPACDLPAFKPDTPSASGPEHVTQEIVIHAHLVGCHGDVHVGHVSGTVVEGCLNRIRESRRVEK